MTTDRLRVGVMGASGYTGADLVRLLLCHPAAEIVALTADRHAGKPYATVFPHLASAPLPDLVTIDEVDWSMLDVVFCGLPHGTTQALIAGLPGSVKVVDLSADFRLRDADIYAEWYGHPHQAPALQGEAVYGLTEWYRPAIRESRLVANPGCYPTAVLLALLPLVSAGLIDVDHLIIDAKSGVSGAGRSLKEANLFCEAGEGTHAYGVGRHRHMPEIEQEIAAVAARPVTVSFTPHLLPMNRGELITGYVQCSAGAGADDLRAALHARYAAEPFVHVLPGGVSPATRHVRGSNLCHIGVFADRRPGHAIVIAAIDNLVKGSSGAAIQNMNLMCGFDETLGLGQMPLFP